MKALSKILKLVSFSGILFFSLTGCIGNQKINNPQENSIKNIQRILGLPELPVTYIEDTKMGNSPDGKLPVAYYQDDEDRKYYVDIKTNLVVEIDARSLLTSISPNAEEKSEAELRKLAEQFTREIIPDFADLSKGLSFEGSGKKNNYFYSWRKEIEEGYFMPPFLQFGFHKSGVLFAYYNTLQIEK